MHYKCNSKNPLQSPFKKNTLIPWSNFPILYRKLSHFVQEFFPQIRKRNSWTVLEFTCLGGTSSQKWQTNKQNSLLKDTDLFLFCDDYLVILLKYIVLNLQQSFTTLPYLFLLENCRMENMNCSESSWTMRWETNKFDKISN